MRYILLIVLFLSSLNGFAQILISENSWFLGASAQEDYIVYLKCASNEADEYVEGNIFIYDINKKESFPLNKESYIIEYVKVHWSSDNNSFFMSSGSSLNYYSFITDKSNILYSTSEEGLVNNFAISNNGSFAVLNEKVFKKGNDMQISYLINIEDKSIRKIYSVEDNSIGETLINEFCFDSSDENIFIRNISNDLICLNIKTSISKCIDAGVSKMFCTAGNNLYYLKNDALVQYNYNSGEILTIIEGKSIEIQYVNGKGSDIVVNLNDNVFLYKTNKGLETLSKLRKGRYVYIKNNLAIEMLEGNLYLHSLQ